jgi:hypothetical protein
MTEETADKQPTDKRLANLKKGKAFVKGFDPRRNLKGVPRDAILMRQHMRKIASEIIGNDDTAMTRLDAMLRQLFTSRNPAHNKLALQVLDPKILTEQVDITSGGERIWTDKAKEFGVDPDEVKKLATEIAARMGDGVGASSTDREA